MVSSALTNNPMDRPKRTFWIRPLLKNPAITKTTTAATKSTIVMLVIGKFTLDATWSTIASIDGANSIAEPATIAFSDVANSVNFPACIFVLLIVVFKLLKLIQNKMVLKEIGESAMAYLGVKGA